MPGDFVKGIVPMYFSYGDRDDSGISEIRKMQFLKNNVQSPTNKV